MGVGDTRKEKHTKTDVLPSQTLSHWSLIPLGKSESQCRTHLRVPCSRDGELRYFFSSCQPVTDSGLPQGNHIRTLPTSYTSNSQRALSGKEMQMLATGCPVVLE